MITMEVKELKQKLEKFDENKELYKTSFDYEKLKELEERKITTGWDKEKQEKIKENVVVVV